MASWNYFAFWMMNTIHHPKGWGGSKSGAAAAAAAGERHVGQYPDKDPEIL
jgi:hypothetical protein